MSGYLAYPLGLIWPSNARGSTMVDIDDPWSHVVDSELYDPVSGVEATALDPLTLAATGAVLVVGSLAVTFGDLSSAAAGSAPATGTESGELDALTVVATGTALVHGAADITLEPLTSGAAGLAPDVTEGSGHSVWVVKQRGTIAVSATVVGEIHLIPRPMATISITASVIDTDDREAA